MTICTNVDAATMEAHGHLVALMNWSDMVKTHYIYIYHVFECTVDMLWTWTSLC